MDETVTLTLTRDEAASLTNLAGEAAAMWLEYKSEGCQARAKFYAGLEHKIREQRKI